MSEFRFRNFSIAQRNDVFKITTDALVLAGLIRIDDACKRVLDVGSGTGVLSLLLKDRFPHLDIVAVDTNEKAFMLTQLNFNNYHQKAGLKALHVPMDEVDIPQVDIVMSNPPYFSKSLKASSTWKATARHDIDFKWSVFFRKARLLTSSTGVVNIIIKAQELKTIHPFHQDEGWHISKKVDIQDTQNGPAQLCFISFRKQSTGMTTDTLILKDASGNYTKEYIDLLSGWVNW